MDAVTPVVLESDIEPECVWEEPLVLVHAKEVIKRVSVVTKVNVQYKVLQVINSISSIGRALEISKII